MSVAVLASATPLLVAGSVASATTPPDGSSPPASSVTTPCVAASGSSASDSTPSAATEPVDTSQLADIDASQAAAVALSATSGVVVDIGRERESGDAVWEVVVRQDDGSGVEHYVAVSNGEIRKQVPAAVPSEADADLSVTIVQAMDEAVCTVPGSTVLEVDLGTDRQRTVWGVLVGDSSGQQMELYIDATTGEVVKQEIAD